ncbi:MAG: ABC transporter permease [Prevotellaceae bacterium]|jgi:putative ABC transport system permease protein|nr:ABC transporter permease [Prevotellaceae bacterium]
MRQLYYTLQTLLRGRSSNMIRLVSLTLGLLIGVLLFSQIAYEFSYEQCYKDPDRVVLLRSRMVTDGVPRKSYDNDVALPAATDLWAAMPDLIESASASANMLKPAMYLGDKKLSDTEVMFVDTNYIQTIGMEVVRGNLHDLASPYTLFLSERKARELFGDEEAIGKVLSFDKRWDVTVRGIYRDLPGSTAYYHNMLMPLAAFNRVYGAGTWTSNDIYYVLFRLHRAEDLEQMNARVQKVVESFTNTRFGDNQQVEYSVLPIRKLHLSYSGTVQRLWILGVLGFSIFFVAIMNYVLAAIASFGRRAKAVGVNKCFGADSRHILGMFMWETALLVLASLLATLLLMHLLQEPIEEMLGVKLSELFTWANLWVPALTVGLLFFIAGVLPGRMFARIPVTQIFRRYTDNKRSWKRGLLFVQFIGVTFILGMLTTTIYQYHSLMKRDIGFDLERLATGSEFAANAADITQAIRRQPYVEAAEREIIPLLSNYNTYPLYDTQHTIINYLHWQTFTGELPQMVGMRLVAGHFPQRSGEALVGRKTAEVLKWGDHALGQPLPGLSPDMYDYLGIDAAPTVVGVVEDIRNMGFFADQACTAFIRSDDSRMNGAFQVRLKEPADDNLRRLNEFVKESYPQAALEFRSYDSIRTDYYSDVYRFRNTVWTTSACILLIVLMGLIGYVNDETARRSKEIAIRKVNGAEAPAILRLLSIDIVKVALGAVAIGAVGAWYLSGIWMDQFAADNPPLSPVWFAVVAVTVLLLIVVCVIVRAWRIAGETPVKSIKSE